MSFEGTQTMIRKLLASELTLWRSTKRIYPITCVFQLCCTIAFALCFVKISSANRTKCALTSTKFHFHLPQRLTSVFFIELPDTHRWMRQSVLRCTALLECQTPNIVGARHSMLPGWRSSDCCTPNKCHREQYNESKYDPWENKISWSVIALKFTWNYARIQLGHIIEYHIRAFLYCFKDERQRHLLEECWYHHVLYVCHLT